MSSSAVRDKLLYENIGYPHIFFTKMCVPLFEIGNDIIDMRRGEKMERENVK